MVAFARVFRNHGGFLQIPLLLTFLWVTLGGFGTWGLLRRWRILVEHQLRMDRCTGRAALLFKSSMENIISDNIRIRALRAAIVAARSTPPTAATIPGLQLTLAALVGHQQILETRWELERILWISRQKCGNSRDLPLPLPKMQWKRTLPDSIGLQALSWQGPLPQDFQIQIAHHPRYAAAHVFPIGKGGLWNEPTDWKAEWTPPKIWQWPSQ